MSDSVLIREVGPREGFQTLEKIIPTEQKLELIDALSLTGVKEIEIASFVRPDKLPQMADADKIVASYKRQANVSYLGLYLNHKGFERAEQSKRLDNKCWIYSAASDAFLKSNNNTTHQQVVKSVPEWLTLFKAHGKAPYGVMISTAFGYYGEESISSSKVVQVLKEIVDQVAQHGAVIQEVSLADTVGLGVPTSVRAAITAVQKEFPAIKISLHLHDTRGAGLANAYAGYLEGVRIFESSVAGLGGCPFAKGASGNIVTEELVSFFEAQGIATGINLERYIEAAKLAQKVTGKALPSKLLRN